MGYVQLYLVGGFNPSEKKSQLGLLFPIYGKIKNVPNHQPVMVESLVFQGHIIVQNHKSHLPVEAAEALSPSSAGLTAVVSTRVILNGSYIYGLSIDIYNHISMSYLFWIIYGLSIIRLLIYCIYIYIYVCYFVYIYGFSIIPKYILSTYMFTISSYE